MELVDIYLGCIDEVSLLDHRPLPYQNHTSHLIQFHIPIRIRIRVRTAFAYSALCSILLTDRPQISSNFDYEPKSSKRSLENLFKKT